MKQYKLKMILSSNKKVRQLVERAKNGKILLNGAWYQDTRKVLAYLKQGV